MKKLKSENYLFFFLLLIIGLSSCAVNPRCPTQLMPIVEVQINNTASAHDDYINSSGYTSCRARITNVRNGSATSAIRTK